MNSMSTTKAISYLHSLDVARCSGAWDAVPELCRKVQKHAPGRRCFALAALTEARLYLLPRIPANATSAAVTSYDSTLTTLQEILRTELDNCPSSPEESPPVAGGGQVGALTFGDVLLARTMLAWIFSLKRDWEAALDVVPTEDELGGEWGGVGRAEYFGITRIKALVLRGIVLGHMNPDPSLSLRFYRSATRLQPTLPASWRDSPSFLLWTERALSHHALAAYRCWLEAYPSGDSNSTRDDGTPIPEGGADPDEPGEGERDGVSVVAGEVVDEATVATAFRGFHNFVVGLEQSQNTQLGTAHVAERGLTPEREVERREVYRNYHKFLSTLLLPDDHPDKPTSQDLRPQNESYGKATGKAGARDQLSTELVMVGSVYEEYLLRGLSFPGAAEFHEVIGEWVDRIMENWRASGGSGEDAAMVVEILYKASTKTFHSPRILRHLFTALTAVGNFPDAVLALDTYIELIQRAKDRISKGQIEKDFDDDKTIFDTVTEGIRVICGLVGDGRKGMELAEGVEKWIDEWNVRDISMLSGAYRGIGFANATWARQTIDGERRPDAQTAAIDAFKKGLTYDILDTDGWYGLALVQVEHGDVGSAMESAKRGLTSLTHLASDDEAEVLWDARGSYRRHAVPLLHLLALLMTATEDFEGASKACESVFEILGDYSAVYREMGIGEKEGLLEAKMTQIAVEEAIGGVEAAVALTDTLLDLYSRLFEATNPSGAELTTSAVENDRGGSPPSTRPTTASRKSRLLGARSLRKEFATSATNLSNDSFGTQPSGGDGANTTTKRPKSGHQSLHHLAGLTSNPNAPKIQVTEHGGSTAGSANPPKKQSRPKSVSGGTIRRMRSLGSLHSSSTSMKDTRPPLPDIPTPPLPISTGTSSVSIGRSPAGSVKGHEHHPHLFHMLKLKLQRHQLQEMGSSVSVVPIARFGGSSTSFTPDGVRTPVDGAGDTMLDRSGLPRAEDIPNNLSKTKLPHPICAIASRITDETRGKGAEPRSVKRPTSLPEPKLKEEDERKRANSALRLVWVFVGGIYRRAGYSQDAVMAIEEAEGLVSSKGDGEADILTEKALLALEAGKEELAAELFDTALFVEVNHPLATVGLTNILLNTSNLSVDDDRSTVTCPLSEGDALTARNRALGLLQQLTSSSRGWDVPGAWFALARAYELGGEIERAKTALWKCVSLEDRRGIRGWGCVRPRIV